MNLTAKQNNKILIHRNMEALEIDHAVDIILTPQFYTFIREDLDVQFSYQAKQIAASLFDDYLDTTYEYQYHVYKCDNLWCFFAYNIEEIDTFLEQIGIEKHRVSKIYFSQQLNDELSTPILLNEKEALSSIDNVVTIVPRALMDSVQEYQTLNLNNIKFKNAISMGSSLNSFVSLKETIILGSLFLILGTVFIVEGNRIRSSIAGENDTLNRLLDDNPKMGSTVLRQSILDKYKPIDTIERAKRDRMKEISKLLSAKSQLKVLSISQNKISAEIQTQNQMVNKQVKEHATANKFRTTVSGLTVKVEKNL